MSTIAQQALIAEAAIVSPAQALDRALRDASPAEVIETALKTVGREHLALVSSFGTESAALLKVMADVDPAIPVVFLDTGWLFEETLAYRDTLIATLGLTRRSLDQAAGRDAVARGSGSRIVVLRSRCLLPYPQGGAAGAGAEAVLGLDQRTQALSGRRARRDSRRRGRRRETEIQSVRQCVARGDRGDLQARQNCRRIRWSPRATCRSAACRARAGPRRTRMRVPAAGAARPRRECGIHTTKTS